MKPGENFEVGRTYVVQYDMFCRDPRENQADYGLTPFEFAERMPYVVQLNGPLWVGKVAELTLIREPWYRVVFEGALPGKNQSSAQFCAVLPLEEAMEDVVEQDRIRIPDGVRVRVTERYSHPVRITDQAGTVLESHYRSSFPWVYRIAFDNGPFEGQEWFGQNNLTRL